MNPSREISMSERAMIITSCNGYFDKTSDIYKAFMIAAESNPLRGKFFQVIEEATISRVYRRDIVALADIIMLIYTEKEVIVLPEVNF